VRKKCSKSELQLEKEGEGGGVGRDKYIRSFPKSRKEEKLRGKGKEKGESGILGNGWKAGMRELLAFRNIT